MKKCPCLHPRRERVRQGRGEDLIFGLDQGSESLVKRSVGFVGDDVLPVVEGTSEGNI